MFSQFRQAVETFAPQQRKSIDAEGNSGDPASPGQVAENGLSHLRSSSTSQRSASPAPKSNMNTPKKSTLEERLRAAAAKKHDSSSRTSPSPSVSSTVVKDHPLSPTSTPLPDSRPTSPSTTDIPPPSISDLAAAPSPTDASKSVTEETQPVPAKAQHGDSVSSTSIPTEPISDPLSASSTTEVQRGDAVSSAAAAEPTTDPLSNPPTTDTLVASAGTDIPELPGKAETKLDPLVEANNTEDIEETDSGADGTVEDEENEENDKPSVEEPPSEPIPTPSADIDDAVPKQESIASTGSSPTVEELQERLQLVEKRFNDVSTSFKRLQAEKLAADTTLREFTPLETFQDNTALREYLENVKMKVEISQEELKRLNVKLERQEDRIEEMRDTHRLESGSQSDQIESLRKQLSETEALLKASQGSATQGEGQLASQKADMERLQKELDKAKEASKEEEEKRVKAISLLKTVRQKLVKAEKDKEDAVKELTTLREQEAAGKAREDAEKAKLRSEIETAHAEREKAVSTLKNQFEKELSLAKERHEKEMSAMKGQFELEAITMKNTHAKELSQKASQLSGMEDKVQALTRDKNEFFDQLQLRQAEMESYQSRADSLQSENVELTHQLRELEDRLALVREELAESRREQERQSREDFGNTEETARLLSAMEAKYEARLSDLKRIVSNLEKERTESEAEWVRKVREKNKEVEELKGKLGSASRLKEQDEGVVDTLKADIERLEEDLRSKESSTKKSEALLLQIKENENTAKSKVAELEAHVKALEAEIEEGKNRELQLRSGNKTLREELRKVQSSVALLDRQRNPGVGYWTSRDASATDSRVSISSNSSDGPAKDRASSSGATKEDEEVNLEYLRNVILQFLEHKEMRPNLVKVLSVILHFTPQETRRMMAKV
ncbi:hypothetical protein V5O48_001629 [Marasmius crinis-equi]|uniref:GRIP domain-containing protein n=1 Tax=Marasmius crinis-equi TaxID=585013 RepID=A0ABR3FY34_9AGAR